jgi:hypothetical protein
MSNDHDQSPSRRAAAAFDVRNVIAGLIGLYGVVLVCMGLFANSDEEMAKTGGVNANLWAGLAMVVFGAAFALWTRLRPVEVDEGDGTDRQEPEPGS